MKKIRTKIIFFIYLFINLFNFHSLAEEAVVTKFLNREINE